MSILHINNVDGLFHELYYPNPSVFDEQDLTIKNNLLDPNNLFWNHMFKAERIKQEIDKLKITDSNYTAIFNHPAIIASFNNVQRFTALVDSAYKNICNQGASAESFFSNLEILQVVCEIYSYSLFKPYKLTIQNGLMTENADLSKMMLTASVSSTNPYYTFIMEHVFPKIKEENPSVIFLNGRISLFHISLSRIIKANLGNIHVCVCNHSSEYYSLNKIDDMLTKNKLLFSVIDSLILEDDASTIDILSSTVINDKDLSKIKNIIYKNTCGEILFTGYDVKYKQDNLQINRRPGSNNSDYIINPSQVSNIKLRPYKKCFWNKCTFCGINKKYHFDDVDDELNAKKLDQLKHLYESGVDYFWFIDEALPLSDLETLSQFFCSEQMGVKWQVRTRLDYRLIDIQLIELLKKAGLLEIRIGLESASESVLERMRKYDFSLDLDKVEKIIAAFTSRGIAVHFPMIIGFPSETKIDRQKTYTFLSEMSKRYKLFRFNINIFMLDVQSDIYKNYSNYGISTTSLSCDKENYLGNYADWTSENKESEVILGNERDALMRERLFPWMPRSTHIKPHILYRLMESIRNTLTQSAWSENSELPDIKQDAITELYIKTNNSLEVIQVRNPNPYLCYIWENHHYMYCGKEVYTILKSAEQPQTIENVLRYFDEQYKSYTRNDFFPILNKLIKFGFLLRIAKPNN